MALGGADRYVTLVQAGAYVALALGVVGVARGLGLTRGEALLGGLLVATLPVIALQSSTAQNDLVVASFAVAAAGFLLQDGRAAPWLAGTAAALAVGTKVTAVVGVPLLVAIALVAPLAHRRAARLAAVLAGSAVGAYWYVVNWHQAGSWDAGFPYEELDRGLEATVARALRSAIQFVELPGGAGRDRWLYAVAALIVLVLAGVGVLRGGRRRIVLGLAALLALAPVLVPDRPTLPRRGVPRAVARSRARRPRRRGRTRHHAVGLERHLVRPTRPAMLVLGRNRRRARRGSESDDCRGSAVLLALAPVYWLVALSALLFYQDAAGRFFMAPVALAGRDVGSRGARPLGGLGADGDRGHDPRARCAERLQASVRRPAARAPGARRATSSEPRWSAQGREVFVPELIRFVDERVPADARVALGITPSDPGYVVLGPALDRRLVSLGTGALDTPGATWAFVSPCRSPVSPRLCGAWRRLPVPTVGLGRLPASRRPLLSGKRATGLEPATFSLEG